MLLLSVFYAILIGLGSMIIFHLDKVIISPIEGALFENGIINTFEFIGAAAVAYLYYKMQNKMAS